MIEMCDLLTLHAADRSVLERDAVVQAAAQRWVEILGEAASHVSEGLRSAHPEVPWREIIGTRVILAHGYFHIDEDVIGEVVTRHVPALVHHLRIISEAIGDD